MGYRPDSKPSTQAGDELVAWLRGRGVDPLSRFVLFCDPRGEDLFDPLSLVPSTSS